MRGFYLGNVFVKKVLSFDTRWPPASRKSLEASRRYQKNISPVLFNDN